MLSKQGIYVTNHNTVKSATSIKQRTSRALKVEKHTLTLLKITTVLDAHMYSKMDFALLMNKDL